MARLDRDVIEWMRRHHTTVTDQMLDAHGIGERRRRELVQDGLLQRVVTGAYRFAGAEPDELMRCIALCTARPHFVIAGPTAGRAWGIRRSPRDGLIHVIAPPQSQPCREPWVKAYRTALIHDDEVVEREDGVRITSPPRTAVDLTRYITPAEEASAIEHVVGTGMCTVTTLHREGERLNTPGRPWARKFLAILATRHDGAACESEWELRVVEALRRRRVAGLELQASQMLPGYGNARFDIAIPSIRWVLEVDVHPEHRTIEGSAGDHRRDRCTRSAGWVVERVGELELATSFDATIDALAVIIECRRAEVHALKAARLWPT